MKTANVRLPVNFSKITPALLDEMGKTLISRAGWKALIKWMDTVLWPLADGRGLPKKIKERSDYKPLVAKAAELWWQAYDKVYRRGTSVLCAAGGVEGELYGHRIGTGQIAGLCDAAGKREQQDALLFSRRAGLLRTSDETLIVVADGMGGHPDGTKASETTVNTMNDIFQAPTQFSLREFSLEGAIKIVNEAVNRLSFGYLGVSPGSTALAALLTDSSLSLVNVGDSRGYLFKNDGEFSILTPDDGGLLTALRCIMEYNAGDAISVKDFGAIFENPSLENLEPKVKQIDPTYDKGRLTFEALEGAGYIKNGQLQVPLFDERCLNLIFAKELSALYGQLCLKPGDILSYVSEISKKGELLQFPLSGSAAESLYEMSEVYPLRHTISHHLGVPRLMSVFTLSIAPQEGDIVIMASDGLNSLPVRELKRIVRMFKDEAPDMIVRALNNAILLPTDNITIVVIKF